MTTEFRIGRDPASVARAAALELARTARGIVARRGRFTLVLSGGETPRLTYQALADRDDIDWSAADLFFGDERAVPADDPASNARLVRETLLATPRTAPARVHRMDAAARDANAAARDYETRLRHAAGRPPRLDIVLLGLGLDGHVASLFPEHAALAERERWVVPTPAPHIAPRLTLTHAAFATARHVFFLVTGSGKAAILRRVCDGPRDPFQLPAQGIAPRHGRVVWFVDRAAWRT